MDRQDFLPYNLPLIEDEEINEVIDSLKSGWITLGPKTIRFEKDIQDYIGISNAVALNSCTAGLHLALIVLGIRKGDEVITTPFTFASTANVIVHTGAKPVFVDIQGDTFNIDPKKIEQAITPNTKAILVVHYAGHPVDMDEIKQIAEKHNLHIIEDAAHAIGSEYKNQKIGSSGNLTSFSFYATKNLTTGEGGTLVTNNDELAKRLKNLRLHGMSKDAWNRYGEKGDWFYEINECGWKYNMTDIQAALGLHQLRKLNNFIEKRKQYADIYNQELSKIPLIQIPRIRPYVKSSYHLYPILLKGVDRDLFIQEMKKRNIGTSVHFIPLHLQPFYKNTFGYKIGDFPIAEKVYKSLVSLPLYPKMTIKDVNDVIGAIKDILKENGKTDLQ